MIKNILLSFIASALCWQQGSAQAGMIDSSFGKNGMLILDDHGRASSIQITDDAIFVAGGYSNAFRLLKCKQNGVPDSNFGDNGVITTQIGIYGTLASALAIQVDHRLLIGGDGGWDGGYSKFITARYHTDGSPDLSFNDSAHVLTAVGLQNSDPSICLQPDGRIVVGGNADYDFALVRYLPNGSLDASFNGSGKVLTPIEDYGGHLEDVLLQADGKIIAVGDVNFGSGTGTGTDVRLIRYNADGSLDASFGTNGKVTTHIGSREAGKAGWLLNDGSILVAGLIETSLADNDFLLLKYLPDGTLDASFGNGGIATADINNLDDIAYCMAVQADGKILLAGRTRYPGGNTSYSIVRFTATGQVDPSFGSNGHVLTSITDRDWTYAIALEKNDKIIIGGQSYDGKMVLIRYHSDVSAGVKGQPPVEELSVYPNPGGDRITISDPQKKYAAYSMQNSMGQTVMKGGISGSNQQIDITSLAPGMYYIRFSAPAQQPDRVMKFTKQ